MHGHLSDRLGWGTDGDKGARIHEIGACLRGGARIYQMFKAKPVDMLKMSEMEITPSSYTCKENGTSNAQTHQVRHRFLMHKVGYP